MANQKVTALAAATAPADADSMYLVQGGVSKKIAIADLFKVPGNLNIPATTGAAVGVVNLGTDRFIHTYGDPASNGRNTFLGKLAGNFTMAKGGGAVTLASQNVGIGENSMQELTTGYDNVSVGYDALMKTTTGYANTAIGTGALHFNVVGLNNLAIGMDALNLNTDGSNNVAIGANAVRQVTLGSFNVGIGTAALDSATGWAGGNTAIGANALGLGSGNYNIAIGYGAGYRATGTGKLYIENQLNASEALDQTHSIIYGVMDATVGNQEITFNVGKMGFFNHVAVSKPTGVAVTAAGIHAALVTLGLIAA